MLAFLAVGVRLAVRAFFVGKGRLLLQQVVGDVDHLDGLALYRSDLRRVAAEPVVAVGDYPAFRPEIAGGSAGEAVDFGLGDVVAAAVFVKLPGFALDGDMLAVAAPHGYAVNADVLPGNVGIVGFPFRPVGPGVTLSNVPLPDLGTYADGKVFQPSAARRVLAGFCHRSDGGFYGVNALLIHNAVLSTYLMVARRKADGQNVVPPCILVQTMNEVFPVESAL